MISSSYTKRAVRFIELYNCGLWQVKIYTLNFPDQKSSEVVMPEAKKKLPEWLGQSGNYSLPTYCVSTLILHKCKEGCFAIVNWWIDENMLQLYVYLATNERPDHFELYSDKGIVTCVWEMAVLWHERNAWAEHVLVKSKPDLKKYLTTVLNDYV